MWAEDALEIEIDGCRRRHEGRVSVGGEAAGIEDGEIWSPKVYELLLGRADEHVADEEGMVGPRTHDPHFDSVL